MNVGAVGVVAKKRGRRFIGFENNQDQILLAMKTTPPGAVEFLVLVIDGIM